jgi:hypothetical protein
MILAIRLAKRPKTWALASTSTQLFSTVALLAWAVL